MLGCVGVAMAAQAPGLGGPPPHEEPARQTRSFAAACALMEPAWHPLNSERPLHAIRPTTSPPDCLPPCAAMAEPKLPFANDGSFLELFAKMQEQQKAAGGEAAVPPLPPAPESEAAAASAGSTGERWSGATCRRQVLCLLAEHAAGSQLIACKRSAPELTCHRHLALLAGGDGSADADAQQAGDSAAAGNNGEGTAAPGGESAADAAAGPAAANAADPPPPPPPRTASEPAPQPAAARPSISGRPASAPAMLLKAKKSIVQVRTRTGEALQPGGSKRAKKGGWQGRWQQAGWVGGQEMRRWAGARLRAVAAAWLPPHNLCTSAWPDGGGALLHSCARATGCPVGTRHNTPMQNNTGQKPAPTTPTVFPSDRSLALLTGRQHAPPALLLRFARLCRGGQGGLWRPQVLLLARAGALSPGGL